MLRWKWMGIMCTALVFSNLAGSGAGWAAYALQAGLAPQSVPVEISEEPLRLAVSAQSTVPDMSASQEPPPPPMAQQPEKKKKSKPKVAPAPKQPAGQEKEKEEEGFFSKTIDSLFGDDDKKKTDGSKPKSGKEEAEEGFLTKTLKSIVGEDDKDQKSSNKKEINPLDMAPTVSATKREEGAPAKTAKSETKEKLKTSFEQLIDAGDKKAAEEATADSAEPAVQSAKKDDSGGLLGNILGGDKKEEKKKTDIPKVKTVKAKSEPAPKPQPQPRKLPSRKVAETKPAGSEEAQLEKDRGAAPQKGKNVLKESFKTLINEEKPE